jgi:hypothetical protein
VHTRTGQQVEREGEAAIGEMEADLRERLGPRDWDGLRDVLARLGAE